MSKARNIADIGSHDVIETDSDGVTVIGDLTIPDKITHSGDTDTSIRFPAADTVTVETSGLERMRIDSSGRVGIGTTSPQKSIEIFNGDDQQIRFRNGASDTQSYDVGRDGTSGLLKFYGNQSGFTGYIFDGADGERMRIDASGNVGIGTTAPQSDLEIQSKTTGTDAVISLTAAGTRRYQIKALTSVGALAFVDESLAIERMRITSSGNVGIGTTAPDCALTIGNNPGTGNLVLHITRPGIADNILVYAADAYSPNAAAATFKIGSQSSTSRSINATGTVNASGTDYAEYMTKAGDFTVAKGDVIGIDENGQLTNVFANSVTFVVKSTNPSIVGGDVWGTVDAIGCEQPKNLPDDASDDEKASYQNELAVFEAALEAARQKVDRIAFAGQVPVNVYGASPGQYIVPANDGGNIKGVSKNEGDMTLADYMKAVGKVISIEADGRARIIVKVA